MIFKQCLLELVTYCLLVIPMLVLMYINIEWNFLILILWIGYCNYCCIIADKIASWFIGEQKQSKGD